MKISQLFSAAMLTAAVLLTFFTSAAAATFSGKVVAMTKGSKSTVIEIAPDNAGNPPAYRCAVSTEFQEIADMLMQTMSTKDSVIVTSSDNCKMTGMLRDCGSVVTVEIVRKITTPPSQGRRY
jgi:hypothetical protein